jgi:hypothetical protein
VIVPFLFSVTPSAPSSDAAPTAIVAPAGTTPAPQGFALLLEQIVAGHPQGATMAPGDPMPVAPQAERTDLSSKSNDTGDSTSTSAIELAAYLMMSVVSPPQPMAAEASPSPEATPASPVVTHPTVEQAIASAADRLGVDGANITVEAIVLVDGTGRGAVPAPVTERQSSSPDVVTPVAIPADTTPMPPIEGDSGAVISDLSLLAPRVRARVERVIARARAELGLDVVVRETLRSQERQDALFAQGRTGPGEVVTWTRRSLHSAGLAADLAIAGEGTTPELRAAAYERLSRIANEEGLTTLGPRDPGHVEFRGGGVLHQTVIPQGNDLKLVPLGKVAPIAQPEVVVAPKPASPAPVARVIAPVPNLETESDADAQPLPTPAHAPAAHPGANAASPAPTTTVAPTLTVADASWHEPAVASTNIAARIEELHSIADVVADRPVSGVVLRLDGDAGNGDRIRIDVRRNVVETSVRAADPALTHRLVADAPVLRSALERQGLEVGRIEVRSQAVAVADARSRGFEGGRDRESSPEPHRRSQHHESRQRQRRNPNQNGESQR